MTGRFDDWTFTGLAGSFDTHVRAHLPHYDDVQAITARVASMTVPAGGTIADLGCSTGTTVATIATTRPRRPLIAHLYDDQPDLLAQASARLTGTRTTAHLHTRDLTTDHPLNHGGADLTLALWVLQFLHPAHRTPLLTRARHGARHGSTLLVAAKLREQDTRWQTIADAALTDHKLTAGVAPETILAKAEQLRGVLIEDSLDELSNHIESAGWTTPETLYRWHSWILLGAHATTPTPPHPRGVGP